MQFKVIVLNVRKMALPIQDDSLFLTVTRWEQLNAAVKEFGLRKQNELIFIYS